MNKDLEIERSKVPFKIEELTNWFYGGEKNVKEKRFLENIFYSDPDLKSDTSYMSHVEKYEEAIRKVTVILKKLKHLVNQGQYNEEIYPKILGAQFLKHLIKEGNPTSVHFDMFIPGIKSMGTQVQQDEWLPKALTLKIIGTYAQTELGHGTYVRGLETTATFDENTKEFVLNTPTLTAYKWWPGNLGHTVNHALVMAQLYTKGKCYGIHAFIVPLRDLETHKPLPGVHIGEIGTKFGYNTVNNGFLGLKNVRIPRKNMLMKNSEVTESGEFVIHKNPLLTYGTMTMIRVGIIQEVQVFLAKAVTIATRYSLVRRQSPINPNDEIEPQIIEHTTQQYKLFVPLAKVFSLKITSDYLWNQYEDTMKKIDKGDLTTLPELHALSCCLKAICTNDAAEGTEICRLSCGGHGFLNSSALPDCYKMITPAQTYEGENTVLYLQTARYLMKTYGEILKGSKVTSTVAYLKKYVDLNSNQRESFDSSSRGILRALQYAAAGKISQAYNNLQQRMKNNNSKEQAFNQSGLDMIKIAEIHGRVYMLEVTLNEIEKSAKNSSPNLAFVFRDILELFSLDLATKYMGEMLQFVNITSQAIEIMQGRLEAVLRRMRQYVIGIVDAFDFSDQILDSTLGAYDGNVYERLIEAAKKSPLNQEDVNKSFHLYLKPFLKSNL
ncbi:hypothetical protein PVAND_016341 [Polypedilum vanderplanki]|uniref:Acyl-coenzyme A oxidase n=1 Tax=Polypedilum vanderplanki TaxID=319348 RepID=A0A9J6BEU3_POLVA|nr:hypothetical protein PVAND_016341 [Polypedilum vanderplanki]